jgi:hypothetical protein
MSEVDSEQLRLETRPAATSLPSRVQIRSAQHWRLWATEVRLRANTPT